MGEPPPGTPREEAERLVVAALATMSLAAQGWLARAGAGHPLATETGECCVCPVCRAIAAVRDPSPDLVERLASGAADVATGVTTLLRAFDTTLRPPTGRARPDAGPDPGADPDADPGADPGDGPARADPWRSATRAPAQRPDPDGAEPPVPPTVVRKAVRKVVPKGDPPRPARPDNGGAAG